MSLFLARARETPLYRELCALLGTEDGNLLERTGETVAEAQIEFLRWALARARPRVVLEVGGTNAGTVHLTLCCYSCYGINRGLL